MWCIYYKKKSKNKGHERYVRIVQTTYDRLQDLKKKAKSWPFGMSSSGCVQILREPSVVPVNNISQCHCQDLLSILFTQKSLSNHRIYSNTLSICMNIAWKNFNIYQLKIMLNVWAM